MKKGFTLIEIIVAVAIVGILAAVVMVSMKSYAASARATKVQAMLSSVIPNMQSCWTFVQPNAEVQGPDNYNIRPICSGGSSYGLWPVLTSVGGNYQYSLGFSETNATCGICSCHCCCYLPETAPTVAEKWHLFANPAKAAIPEICFQKNSSWNFAASSASDNKKICCNSTMNGCKIIDNATMCTSSIN